MIFFIDVLMWHGQLKDLTKGIWSYLLLILSTFYKQKVSMVLVRV
jgi:hypothetical protein